MTYQTVRTKIVRPRAAALAIALLLGACAEDEADEPVYTPTPEPIVADAQVAWEAGAPVGFDASVVGSDAGMQPDAQTVQTDGSVVDAASEAGAPDDASASDASVTTPRSDLGKGNGKDVITIGDSWMLLVFTGIQESLVSVSRQPYRTYGFPGTKLLNGDIPAQLDRAKGDDPNIKTVVMTGGGNDILLEGAGNDCPTGGPQCTAQLDKIAVSMTALWKKMSESGVQDVIQVMYSAAAVANNPVKNLPAHNERLKQLCAAVPPPMRCHQLNTDSLAMDLRADGIHPTDAAYDRIGKAVFDLMVKEGMRR